MKNYKKVIILCELIITSFMLSGCYDEYPIEDLGILLGVGYDIDIDDNVTFVDPAEIPIIGEKKVSSTVYIGRGHTIMDLVENRMTKMPSRFSLGTELVAIISEERAKFGIEDILDGILRDPNAGLKALLAVNEGECVKYFSGDSVSDETNSDVLYNEIKLSHLSNFFTKKITVDHIIRMYFQEGRKVCLPYIELNDNKPQITGLALFSDDKMMYKLDMRETKLLNLLRNDDGHGYLHLSANEDINFFDIEKFDQYSDILSGDPIKYLDFNGESKRKVKVSKIGERLKYDITIDISGYILLNTLIEQNLDKKTIHLVEETFVKKLEEMLNEEIIKIQKEYREDFLDITQYAVAKYGRHNKCSSNEYFENAIINVKVNFTINSVGRNSKN
ncbi:Ger(x)C family spore germination protein [Vallitalea sediminicola]